MRKNMLFLLLLIAATAAATCGVTALLLSIHTRKMEGLAEYVRLVEVTEDTTDPAPWGVNWPKQYDAYRRTATATRNCPSDHQRFSVAAVCRGTRSDQVNCRRRCR